MKKINIFAWIFIGLAIASAVFFVFNIINLCLLNTADSYSCGFGGTFMLVGLYWLSIPLFIIGTLIFLVGWLIRRTKNKK